ncbi:putative membrane protein [Bordetella petrii]|uniref:Membrane protein n=2 Tax=Bordetella petrii TaxID=94624 RepID=A9IMC2_BORPD|nr:putative membrane protein [Bordetella petrii]
MHCSYTVWRIDMKRELLSWAAAMAVMGAMAGGAQAQSTPDTGAPSSTSPSTTPNDGSAVPPNTPVPAGQIPPAGETAPAHRSEGSMGSQGSMDAGTGAGTGQMGSPGSKTGMPQDRNQVPDRNEPGSTEPKMPNTGGK